jgi:hypothetical protein
MVYLVNFDMYICYTCDSNTKKEIPDDEFFDKYPQPNQLVRSICIHASEKENNDQLLQELIIPKIKRCTAIDNCKDDPLILKKNDDLYVSNNALNSYDIKSSITFEIVPNYRYNESTQLIEKIDPTIEEEDRRLIILQKNPNATLFEKI